MASNAKNDLHPSFPHTIWVVVERPGLSSGSRADDLSHSDDRSLFHTDRFTGTSGRVAGLGHAAPGHCPVVLVCDKRYPAGATVEAHVCGIYLRDDGQHTLVAVDSAIHGSPCTLSDLADDQWRELESAFPDRPRGHGVGWFGREQALDHLTVLREGKR